MQFLTKSAKLATLEKLANRSNNDCRIRNQQPKIREVQYFSRSGKISVDQCSQSKVKNSDIRKIGEKPLVQQN